MTQAIKGVVWAHGPTTIQTGETLHKYVVVAAIVTDKPVAALEDDPSRRVPSETVLCGACPGLLEALATADQGHATRLLGDATMVLVGLSAIQPGPAPGDEEPSA